MTRRTVALLLTLAACQSASGSERQAGASSPPSAAGRIIDSLLPIEEEIRRFREAVPEVPASLTGGEPSRDALVRRWAAALEQRDSAALGSMLKNSDPARATMAAVSWNDSSMERRTLRWL